VEENGEKYLGLDFQEPEFLKQDGFNINLELIKDEKTKSLIEGEESYESLFKLILSAFRKIKKRPGGFFTQGAIEQFNILVREISNHLNNSLSVVESMIPTFDQFRNGKKTFVPQEETEDEEDTEDEVEEVPRAEIAEDPVDDQSDDPVVIEAPKEVEAEEVAVPIDLDLVNQIKDILGQNDPISDQTLINPGKEVNIVIGKFQPFNNGHLKLIKKANQSNGLPVVIMVVNSPKNFIKGEIMDKMMSIISNELPDVVDSYKYIDNDLLSSALEGLHGKYNPKTLTIGTKRLDNYLLQARSLKKRKKLDKDFILQTAPEWVSSSEILNDLGEKNYLNFKKNVPKGLASIWEESTRCYESSK
jgi:nicotinamide mononucleotide adenylyltransferase